MDKSIIRRVSLFSTLPATEIDVLAAGLDRVLYPAGTVLFREGEHGDRFYIVAEGQVEILKAMDSEQEHLLARRRSGEFIGEMSLLNRDGLRTASARVQTEAVLFEMTRSDFDALLNRRPTIAYEMLRVLSMRLNAAHNAAIGDLQEKNRRLAEAYTELQAAQEQIIEKEMMERELLRARQIQESMLPRGLPALEGFDIGARMVPARAVGGDFFDFIQVDPETLAVAVGDVSGKGVPAALYMALAASLLRAEARGSASPDTVLRNVNAHLLRMNIHGMFVTILYGLLRCKTGEFRYVRAGHECPVLRKATGSTQTLASGKGQLIGLFQRPVLEMQSVNLKPGSTLVVYSDGVTEAVGPDGEFFGQDRFESTVSRNLKSSAQDLCDDIVETLTAFQPPAHQADDITVVTLRALG